MKKLFLLALTGALCLFGSQAFAQISTDGTTTNSGASSTASGLNAISSGNRSVALGQDLTAAGNNSVVLGWQSSTSAAGREAVALGRDADVTARGGLSLGFDTNVRGSFASAIGHRIDADGIRSTALGFEVATSATQAIAIGNGRSGFPLNNNLTNTIMMATNSDFPTFFISNSGGAAGSTGNVGIATTAPLGKLDVRGDNILLTQPGVTPATLGGGLFAAIGESGGAQGGTITGCDLYGFRAQSSDEDFVNLGIVDPRSSNPQSVVTWGTGSLQFLYDNGSGKAGCGTAVVEFFGPSGSTDEVQIYGDLAVSGVFPTSDRRFKQNISGIQNALDIIQSLNGTTYEFRTDEFPQRNFNTGTQYGFIAQEIQKVIPTAVMLDNEGYYGVNYDAIIPVLTEGVKEQQEIIDEQAAEIAELKERMARIEKMMGQNNPTQESKAQLFQNVPNPTNGNTVIPFFIPSDVNDARIEVLDTFTGRTVAQQEIAQRGKGEVRLDVQNLQEGNYAYVLIIDGVRTASKQMSIQR